MPINWEIPYSHNTGMPNDLDVTCSQCKKAALFRSALIFEIKKEHFDYFSKHPSFESHIKPTTTGNLYYVIYYAGLHSSRLKSIKDLPEIYSQPQTFSRMGIPENLKRSLSVLGTFICNHCAIIKKHPLSWPKDAFYQWEAGKGKTLWAWNREYALALKDYICSKNRKRNSKHQNFFAIIPAYFKKAALRESLCKKITASLGTGT